MINAWILIAMFLLMIGLFAGAFILFVWGIVRWKALSRNRLLISSVLAVLGGVGLGAAMIMAAFHSSRVLQLAMLENHDFLTKVGEPAPDFEVTSPDGKQVRLSDLRGQVVVVNFFATWCGPCLAELPHLQKMWDDYRDNPRFMMLIVGREETADTVKAFQKENGYTFPMVPDPTREVFNKFAKDTVPRTVVIDGEGRVIYQVAGYYDLALAKIERLVQEELRSSK